MIHWHMNGWHKNVQSLSGRKIRSQRLCSWAPRYRSNLWLSYRRSSIQAVLANHWHRLDIWLRNNNLKLGARRIPQMPNAGIILFAKCNKMQFNSIRWDCRCSGHEESTRRGLGWRNGKSSCKNAFRHSTEREKKSNAPLFPIPLLKKDQGGFHI